MTQEEVNRAKVLYRTGIRREEVEKAERLCFTTPQLQKILESPIIPLTKKNKIIEKVFALENLPEKLVKFCKIMCRQGYFGEMQDIFKAYYLYWDQMNHILRADLIFSEKPDPVEEKEVEELLKKQYPEYKLILTQKVDEKLLGGYLIQMWNSECDRSYEGRLRQLERKLTGR